MFYVREGALYQIIPLSVSIVSGVTGYHTDLDISLKVGRADILLVDDDGGNALETYYMDALNSQNRQYEHYDKRDHLLVRGHLSYWDSSSFGKGY